MIDFKKATALMLKLAVSEKDTLKVLARVEQEKIEANDLLRMIEDATHEATDLFMRQLAQSPYLVSEGFKKSFGKMDSEMQLKFIVLFPDGIIPLEAMKKLFEVAQNKTEMAKLFLSKNPLLDFDFKMLLLYETAWVLKGTRAGVKIFDEFILERLLSSLDKKSAKPLVSRFLLESRYHPLVSLVILKKFGKLLSIDEIKAIFKENDEEVNMPEIVEATILALPKRVPEDIKRMIFAQLHEEYDCSRLRNKIKESTYFNYVEKFNPDCSQNFPYLVLATELGPNFFELRIPVAQ